jgi:hypothetical protein
MQLIPGNQNDFPNNIKQNYTLVLTMQQEHGSRYSLGNQT